MYFLHAWNNKGIHSVFICMVVTPKTINGVVYTYVILNENLEYCFLQPKTVSGRGFGGEEW